MLECFSWACGRKNWCTWKKNWMVLQGTIDSDQDLCISWQVNDKVSREYRIITWKVNVRCRRNLRCCISSWRETFRSGANWCKMILEVFGIHLISESILCSCFFLVDSQVWKPKHIFCCYNEKPPQDMIGVSTRPVSNNVMLRWYAAWPLFWRNPKQLAG